MERRRKTEKAPPFFLLFGENSFCFFSFTRRHTCTGNMKKKRTRERVEQERGRKGNQPISLSNSPPFPFFPHAFLPGCTYILDAPTVSIISDAPTAASGMRTEVMRSPLTGKKKGGARE